MSRHPLDLTIVPASPPPPRIPWWLRLSIALARTGIMVALALIAWGLIRLFTI